MSCGVGCASACLGHTARLSLKWGLRTVVHLVCFPVMCLEGTCTTLRWLRFWRIHEPDLADMCQCLVPPCAASDVEQCLDDVWPRE